MKKMKLLFAAMALCAGIFTFSCTKENSPASTPEIQAALEAIQLDNSTAEINGIIEDYQTMYPTVFVDPTVKATVADGPITIIGAKRKDSCVTITIVKTPVTGGYTIKTTIDYGTKGCVCSDGKTRSGSIVNIYSWVKEGGWSRESTITNLSVNGEVHTGTISSTFSLFGPNKHAYWTEKTKMKVTAKDGSWREFSSERNREKIEGNASTDINKIIFKITGSSKGSNSKGFSYTSQISADNPLIKPANCTTFTKGTIVTTNSNGKTTTIDYGDGTCKKQVTIKGPTNDGKGTVTTNVKIGA